MNQLYFLKPFCLSGDRTVIGMTVDPSGLVSFDQGWGPNYQLDPTANPGALDIDRASTNYLMWGITQSVKAWQENAYPEWITTAQAGGTPFAYAAGTIVKYSTTGNAPFTLYVATPDVAGVTASTSIPGVDNQWAVCASRPATTPEATAMTSNTVIMTPATTKVSIQQYITSLNIKQFATGQIVPWSMNTPPAGTLVCNGAAVSRATYANLFALIGSSYGPGDGATTFNLPSFNAGDTLRASDGLAGAGATFPMFARANGSVIAHNHTAVSSNTDGGHNHGGTIGTTAAGNHTHSASTDLQGAHTHNATADSQGAHVHNIGTTGVSAGHTHVQGFQTIAYSPGGSQVNVIANYTSGNAGATAGQSNDHTHGGNTDTQGAHVHNISVVGIGNHNHNVTVNGVGDHTHAISVPTDGVHGHTITVNNTGTTGNIASGANFLMCIAF